MICKKIMGATLALAVLFSGGVSFANEKQNCGYMYTINLLKHSITPQEDKLQLEIEITDAPYDVVKFKYEPFDSELVGINDLVKAWRQDDPSGFYSNPPNAILKTSYGMYKPRYSMFLEEDEPQEMEVYTEQHIKLSNAVYNEDTGTLTFDVESAKPDSPVSPGTTEGVKTGFLYIDGRSNFQCHEEGEMAMN